MTGWLARDRTTPRRVEVTAATLTASIPDRLRNSEFFKMRSVVTDRTDMIDANVAVAPALCRNMTINSMVPAASDEEIKPGAFRFRHGPLKVKIDGQVNPPLTIGTEGELALYDGDTRVAAPPVRIRVLP
ncbi:hypothetical protein [uncultured Sphingomonas sp.]|uniref:hypothetical protein n=1 Tax=uncultured Sphingomonas sp. TaxID=158754 RepID=UPI003749F8D0